MSITNPGLAIWPIWANYGFGGWIPISSSLSDVFAFARPPAAEFSQMDLSPLNLARSRSSLARSVEKALLVAFWHLLPPP